MLVVAVTRVRKAEETKLFFSDSPQERNCLLASIWSICVLISIYCFSLFCSGGHGCLFVFEKLPSSK